MNHSKLISNLILKTVKIQSGPAAVALQELSGVLVTLTALLGRWSFTTGSCWS